MVLSSSPYRSGTTERFVVQGEKATFSTLGLDIQEEQLRAGLMVTAAGFGEQAYQGLIEVGDSVTADPLTLEDGKYHHLFDGLAEAIAGNQPSPVCPISASKVIYAIELAQRASETGTHQLWDFQS